MSEMRATPRNNYSGLLADVLLALDEYAQKPRGDASDPTRRSNPVLGGLSDLVGLGAIGRTVDRMSYGEPLTTGKGMATQLRPDTKEALLAAPISPRTAVGVASIGSSVADGGIGRAAIDPAAQKKLVQALASGGSDARYRLGDLTRRQAAEIDIANGVSPRGLLDVFVRPSGGERHVFDGRVLGDGFTPAEVGLFAKQAMRPDSDIFPPFKSEDYGMLSSKQMLDPVTRMTYSAQMPLAVADDGFELVTVIPKGLPKRKPPKP